MKTLVIGDTSQLAQYFDSTNTVKISSRLPNFLDYSTQQWDTVYICFAEQRTYLAQEPNMQSEFGRVNYHKTLEVIKEFMPCSRRVVYYSTAELWNNTVGAVDMNTPFSFHQNHYTISKYDITHELQDKSRYPNVSICYPFNFNSVYRRYDYLMGKVFRSIIESKPIVIGDVDYFRDMTHPYYVVTDDIGRKIGEDYISGTGNLVHVGRFIERLYLELEMSFDKYVQIKPGPSSIYRKNIFYAAINQKNCNVLKDTIAELKEEKEHYESFR